MLLFINNHHTNLSAPKTLGRIKTLVLVSSSCNFPRSIQDRTLKKFSFLFALPRWNSLPPTWKDWFCSTMFAKLARLSTLRILSIPMFVLSLSPLRSYDLYILIFTIVHNHCMEIDYLILYVYVLACFITSM